MTEVVAWAASNGDRSENADYQYGKRRLRQIDGRIRFLTKRIEAAEVVDPEAPRAGQAATRAFFGATVRYANAAGAERVVSIVGTDEVDLNRNHISWVSPLGRALMKSAAGDSVVLQLPGGTEYLTVLEVCYERISVEPFREPPGSEASAKGLPRRRNPPDEKGNGTGGERATTGIERSPICVKPTCTKTSRELSAQARQDYFRMIDKAAFWIMRLKN